MPLSISINISLPTIYMYVHVHVYLYVYNMSMYPCLMMFCISVAQFPKYHMYCTYVRVQLYVELVQCRVNVKAVGYISRLCHEQYMCTR